jgi:hypothetical protein
VTAWILTWPTCILLGFGLERLFESLYPPVALVLVLGTSFGLLALAFLRQRRERGDAIALAAS